MAEGRKDFHRTCVAFGLSVFAEAVLTPREVEVVQKGTEAAGTNPRAL